MANQGNTGGRGGSQGGSSNRGFASMDDSEQRRIAQKGGEVSAREQKRDERGHFAGSGRGGSSGGSGGSGGAGSSSGGGNRSGSGGSGGSGGNR